MATVADILHNKGRHVATCGSEDTVLAAVQDMNRRRIGALVVQEGGRVVGVFTERDVLQRVVATMRDPSTTTVGDVMTDKVACSRPETSLDEARSVMARHRIRHLPVCNEDGLLEGIISIGDLNAWEIDGKEETIHWLHEYIAGRV